jgi:YD repeat-containing protein
MVQKQTSQRKPQSVITTNHFENALTYDDYVRLSEERFAGGRTTSDAEDLNTPKHIEFTHLNLQRMRRIYNTTILRDDLTVALKHIAKPLVWLVLTESWCGDAAQCVPVIALMANATEHITLKLLLRDKNPYVMDAYLTGTSRAIPRLICLDAATLEEIGSWGPRPAPAQAFVNEQRAQNIDHDTMIANVHAWYAKDKTASLQAEMVGFIQAWAEA